MARSASAGIVSSEDARYSIETDRTIATFDDDFIEDVPPSRYRAVLFFEDETIPAREISELVHTMSQVYPHDEVEGLQKTGREWLC